MKYTIFHTLLFMSQKQAEHRSLVSRSVYTTSIFKTSRKICQRRVVRLRYSALGVFMQYGVRSTGFHYDKMHSRPIPARVHSTTNALILITGSICSLLYILELHLKTNIDACILFIDERFNKLRYSRNIIDTTYLSIAPTIGGKYNDLYN